MAMPQLLEGQTGAVGHSNGMPRSAVVLGGGSDLAMAVLRELAGRGLRAVLLAGRRPDALEGAADELRGLGIKQVETAVFDAREVGTHAALAELAAERIGVIDLVVVATGVLGDGGLDGLSPDRVADEITTNFTGLAAAMIAFARILRRQGNGRILVFSSAAAIRVRRANFVYGASKAGLDGFSQGLGDALAGSGVEVVVVRPGFVRTKMTEGRPKMPLSTSSGTVASAVIDSLCSGARVVWVPRLLRYVMPIVPHLPRWFWRRIPG